MSSTFNRIDEVLGPIKNAVKELQQRNDMTQDQIGQVLASTKRTKNLGSAKPPIKRSKTSLPYLL